MEDKNPLVSVIVPTYNSESTIDICLQSIKNQTYPNIEIIVVDNNSSDNTKKIADMYASKIFSVNMSRSPARNYGAKDSKGDYLFFVDSDMELTPRVVEECVDKIQEKGIGGVIVPEISVGEGFWSKCKALERSCYIGDRVLEAARFIDKDVFWAIGGYDEDLVAGEDRDLHYRVANKYKIERINNVIMHHEGKLTVVKIMKRCYLYGATIDRYFKKHKKLAKKQFTPFRPAYFRNWKTLVRDPMHTVGFMFMKVCEFGAAGVGWFWSLASLKLQFLKR